MKKADVEMLRHTFCEIDLDAIRHNVRVMRACTQGNAAFLAVVKADGYGHGAVQVARAALEAGASMLAVAIPEEGIELREAGIAAPVLVLGGAEEEASEEIVRHDLTQVVFDETHIRALAAAGLATFYWMPSEKVGQGEVDFVFQDSAMRVVPVEVKSGRNVKAKSLARLIREGRSERSYLLSERNFAKSPSEVGGCTVCEIPLYAAFCLDEDR